MKLELKEHIEALQSGPKERDEIYDETTDFEETTTEEIQKLPTGKDFRFVNSFYTHYVLGFDKDNDTPSNSSYNETSPSVIETDSKHGDSTSMAHDKPNIQFQSSNE